MIYYVLTIFLMIMSLLFLIREGLSPAPLAAGYFAIYCIYHYSLSHSVTLRDLFSSYIKRSAARHRPEHFLTVANVRSQFTDTVFPESKRPENHTHPESACNRNCSATFADVLGRNLGLTPHFVQMSCADERNGRTGSRSYYWAKDTAAEPSDLKPTPYSLMTYIDVDQYVDMPSRLVSEFLPTLISTFQPHQVARSDSEYAFTFNENSEVKYSVAGSAEYSHKVWNYCGDTLMLHRSFLGFVYATVIYAVDRRNNYRDHDMIMLTPVNRWYGLSAHLVYSVLAPAPLERLQVAHNEFLRLCVMTAEGMFMSTGNTNSYSQATIPIAQDEILARIAATSRFELTLPQVRSVVKGDEEQATVLLQYHRAGVALKPNVVYPVERGVRRYQFGEAHGFDPEAKPSTVAFMSPLLHGAFSPDNTVGNEKRCVAARISAVQSNVPLTPFLHKTMIEFLKCVIPDEQANKLHPTDEDELYRRQCRPSQRRILEVSNFIAIPNQLIKMFMKKETYGDVKDPRPISTIDGGLKGAYSKFIYPLSELIKTMSWYAFGKQPLAIAQRIVDILEKADSAANTDLSKFDGRVSPALRHLERLFIMRAYAHRYHDEVLTLHRSQYNQKAVGFFGTKYTTGTARASGSPETACFNSLVNAYIAFLAKRCHRVNNCYPTPEAAYAGLGIYGGDDGLTPDVSVKSYIKAAVMVGQQLTVEPVMKGKMGIKFLARVYGPNVWYGDLNSCCDLPRQLSKLHVTRTMPPKMTAVDKLADKSYAYYLTDRNTPIIGEFVSKVVKLLGREYVFTNELGAWNAEASAQYPNDSTGWMEEYAEQALPTFDYQRFVKWLAGWEPDHPSATLHDLLSPPLCIEPKTATSVADAVVDEEPVKHIGPRGNSTKKFKKTRSKRQTVFAKVQARAPKKAQVDTEHITVGRAVLTSKRR